MKSKRIQLTEHFIGMMLAAGLLFFIAAALSEPFKKLVLIMNDAHVTKTGSDWVKFFSYAMPIGGAWASLWLWFKACEKRFLELWFKPPSE